MLILNLFHRTHVKYKNHIVFATHTNTIALKTLLISLFNFNFFLLPYLVFFSFVSNQFCYLHDFFFLYFFLFMQKTNKNKKQKTNQYDKKTKHVRLSVKNIIFFTIFFFVRFFTFKPSQTKPLFETPRTRYTPASDRHATDWLDWTDQIIKYRCLNCNVNNSRTLRATCVKRPDLTRPVSLCQTMWNNNT